MSWPANESVPRRPDARTWSIKPGEIHVWRIWLDRESSAVHAHFPELSAEERSKADSFRRDLDRTRYITTHLELRRILGFYLGLPPAQIRFGNGPFGKPRLANGHSRLRFSLSHSRDLAVVAVAFGREVGIDVEFIDGGTPIMQIARKFLPASDHSHLITVEPSSRTAEFFRCWVRNEARLKAQGTGFAAFDRDGDRRGVCEIVDLPVGAEYKAALAVAGRIDRIRLRRWTRQI